MIDVRWRPMVLAVAWMCQIVPLALCNRRAFSGAELRDIHTRLGKKTYVKIDELRVAITRDARQTNKPEWRLKPGKVKARDIATDSDTAATGPDSDGHIIDDTERIRHNFAYGLKFLPHWVLHFAKCMMEDGSTTAGNTVAGESSHRINCALIWRLISKQGGAAAVEFRMEQLIVLMEFVEDILAGVPEVPPERKRLVASRSKPVIVCTARFDVQPLQVGLRVDTRTSPNPNPNPNLSPTLGDSSSGTGSVCTRALVPLHLA